MGTILVAMYREDLMKNDVVLRSTDGQMVIYSFSKDCEAEMWYQYMILNEATILYERGRVNENGESCFSKDDIADIKLAIAGKEFDADIIDEARENISEYYNYGWDIQYARYFEGEKSDSYEDAIEKITKLKLLQE